MKRALIALALIVGVVLAGSAVAKEIDCTGDDCDSSQLAR